MPSLIITNGDQNGTHFELAKRPLSIGREPSRDIQIIDPKVSRKHAIVRSGEKGYSIAPIKALNGIIINGEPVSEETDLKEGDEITLGDTVLLYSMKVVEDQTNAVFKRKNADRPMRESNTIM